VDTDQIIPAEYLEAGSNTLGLPLTASFGGLAARIPEFVLQNSRNAGAGATVS